MSMCGCAYRGSCSCTFAHACIASQVPSHPSSYASAHPRARATCGHERGHTRRSSQALDPTEGAVVVEARALELVARRPPSHRVLGLQALTAPPPRCREATPPKRGSVRSIAEANSRLGAPSSVRMVGGQTCRRHGWGSAGWISVRKLDRRLIGGGGDRRLMPKARVVRKLLTGADQQAAGLHRSRPSGGSKKHKYCKNVGFSKRRASTCTCPRHRIFGNDVFGFLEAFAAAYTVRRAAGVRGRPHVCMKAAA